MKGWEITLGIGAGVAIGALAYHFIRASQMATVAVTHPETGATVAVQVPASTAAQTGICIDNCRYQCPAGQIPDWSLGTQSCIPAAETAPLGPTGQCPPGYAWADANPATGAPGRCFRLTAQQVADLAARAGAGGSTALGPAPIASAVLHGRRWW